MSVAGHNQILRSPWTILTSVGLALESLGLIYLVALTVLFSIISGSYGYFEQSRSLAWVVWLSISGGALLSLTLVVAELVQLLAIPPPSTSLLLHVSCAALHIVVAVGALLIALLSGTVAAIPILAISGLIALGIVGSEVPRGARRNGDSD